MPSREIRRWLAWSSIAAMLLLAGCSVRTRPADFEIKTAEGRWTFRGPSDATLRGRGWEIAVVESEISDVRAIPYLHAVVVEVRAQSHHGALLVPAEGVVLSYSKDDAVVIGPDEDVAILAGEARRFAYRPGLRAKLLPYPFRLRVTFYRDDDLAWAEQVDIWLH